MTTNEPIPYGANTLRLNATEWCAVAIITAILLTALPIVWRNVEPFEPGNDYRIPFTLSNDYWLYQRWTDWTAAHDRIAVIGDSVIWGEYVRPDQTLTHFLNEYSGKKHFVNAAVAGTHPLALEGLVRDYAGDIRNTRVMLHLNLLWLSAPERDLSRTAKEVAFNHPQLIPQFSPSIPAYPASISDRIGNVFDRYMPVRRWVHHMRVAWFDSLDAHSWTFERPYTNPLAAIDVHLPQPSRQPRHGGNPVSWKQRGIEVQNMDWVPLEKSLQWAAFLRTVELLTERGNRVFVVIGPFNSHMLKDHGRQTYETLLNDVLRHFQQQQIAHFAVPVLPSDQYADASHPLADGYAGMAVWIDASPAFRRWLE